MGIKALDIVKWYHGHEFFFHWIHREIKIVQMTMMMLPIFFLLFISLPSHLLSLSIYEDQDYGRLVPDVIKSRGFELETHQVITDDSYILTVFRIVNPLAPKTPKSLKPVVLSHGLVGSGNDFLVTTPGGDLNETIYKNRKDLDNVDFDKDGNNLGFILANLGYDVWLLQSRGTYYSLGHQIYDADKDAEYWQFTFDDMALSDAPAVIGHILNVTQREDVAWIGHSQGTSTMFALLADRPEYSKKVKPFIALGPAVRMDNSRASIVGFPFVQDLLITAGHRCFGPSFLTRKFAKFCENPIFNKICAQLSGVLLGFDKKMINETRLPIYVWNDPSGTSCWNLAHFGQIIHNKQFKKMDYGWRKNLERYGSVHPPKYDLAKIDSPDIALFYGPADTTVGAGDVDKLIDELQVDLLLDYEIPAPNWNHLDHIFSSQTGLYQNNVIALLLDQYRDGQIKSMN
ncbi:lysosomal acid lipase/cholesteryl ester hydrolase-like [Brevipalpus obovatus]|uniref:lysosomal acid lipase/cholesteryl ester hydrolase-like n=1 Tax=Brevipalpus obovatus TaxID=246614 RepID=UPI003D9EE5CA